ncbi:MAG: hypothetical protein ACREVV_03060 [Steroidobacteraceae bacterium]
MLKERAAPPRGRQSQVARQRSAGTIAGYTLAFDLYDELFGRGGDWVFLEDTCRDGALQDDVFLRYLDRLHQMCIRDAEMAFSKLMTDMLGSIMEGAPSDPGQQAKAVGLEPAASGTH